MESIDLKSLNLRIEESRDIINYIAQKRAKSKTKKEVLVPKNYCQL